MKKRLADIEKEIIPIIKNIDLEMTEYLNAVNNMEKLDSALLFGENDKDKGVPYDAMHTVGAITYILKKYSAPEDVLLESVRLGGDTDTTASIALGINLMHSSMDSLPSFLYSDLTNHRYGRDFLVKLGAKLGNKFYKPLISS